MSSPIEVEVRGQVKVSLIPGQKQVESLFVRGVCVLSPSECGGWVDAEEVGVGH